jgi:hypothetical protein
MTEPSYAYASLRVRRSLPDGVIWVSGGAAAEYIRGLLHTAGPLPLATPSVISNVSNMQNPTSWDGVNFGKIAVKHNLAKTLVLDS